MSDWKIYQGTHTPHDGIARLPGPPPWRDFAARGEDEDRGKTFQAGPREVEVVNTALYLRRPLLVTGPPGSGKSSLAYAVAWELKLGKVLRWSINSRSTLADGLYRYDALARLRDANLEQFERARSGGEASTPGGQDIGRYLRLGPLGTALLPASQPRVLLIDEIDKSDIDLPNDLLHVFEEGEYEIPELERLAHQEPSVRVLPSDGEGEESRVVITRGKVCCEAFPFVVLTSNGERELPPAFLRRCVRLDIPVPDREKLRQILQAHLQHLDPVQVEELLAGFLTRRDSGRTLATDQLLNAVFLLTRGRALEGQERQEVLEIVFRELGGG
jgi:MoxR-like ATPase